MLGMSGMSGMSEMTGMLGIKSVIFDHDIEGWYIEDARVPYHILMFVASGAVSYTIGGKELLLREGEAMFIPAGTSRSAHNVAGSGHQKYAAHFLGGRGAEQALAELATYALQPVRLQSAGYFRQRFSMLLTQWFAHPSGSPLIAEGILLELLGRLAQEVRQQPVSPVMQGLVSRMQSYIVHHYGDQIRLEDLARHIGRSPNHVSKLFKQVLGQTPMEYIHEVKIAVACELLRSSDMNIAEISDHLGYCEQSYFHRVFKKYTGASPSAVQKGTAPAGSHRMAARERLLK